MDKLCEILSILFNNGILEILNTSDVTDSIVFFDTKDFDVEVLYHVVDDEGLIRFYQHNMLDEWEVVAEFEF